MFAIDEAKKPVEVVISEHTRMPDFAGQKQVLRVPVAFVSLDDQVALMPDEATGRLGLPYEEFPRWPTTNLRDISQIPGVVAKYTFKGGRKTPIDTESARHLRTADVTGREQPVRTLHLPMGVFMNATSDDRALESAIGPAGEKRGTQWVNLDEARTLASGIGSPEAELDHIILSVLVPCLLRRARP